MDVDFKVEGLRELSRSLRQLGDADLKKALTAANKTISQAVVDKAMPFVPVGATGRLAASVKALASQQSAKVKAGSARVPYAAAQHWGTGPRPGKRGPHNIRSSLFLRKASVLVEDEAPAIYLEQIRDILRKAGIK